MGQHPLRLTIKARPAAKHARGARLIDIGDGKEAIEVTVAAQAVDGKANEAILKAVAEGLGVKPAAVTLKSGHTGKLKIIEVQGDPAELEARLKLWLQELF